jgi:hypothetical protein
MKTRLLALVLVLMLSFTLASTVGAQDALDTCYQLSSADCDFLTAALANPASSFNYTMGLDFSADLSVVEAMGEGGPTNVTVSAQGNGAFILNPDAADPNSAIALSVYLQGAANDGMEETPFDVGLVIVDGNAYFSSMEETGGEWMGAPLDMMLEQADMPFDIMALLSGDMDPMDVAGATGMGDMGGMADASGFITQTRLPDEDMMGQTTYPFQTTFDIAALLNAPEFQEIMSSGMAGMGDDAAMAMMFLPMMMDNMVLTVNYTQWYGANDSFIHRIQVDGDVSLDLSALIQMMGEEAPANLPPLTAKLIFWIDLADHNGAVSVVAPEGAMMMPEGG